MKCCLCNKKIEVIGTWKEGHNAQPLKNGRCCTWCNDTKVLPARLKMFFNKPSLQTEIQILKDKLHRRNMQIKNLQEKLNCVNCGKHISNWGIARSSQGYYCPVCTKDIEKKIVNP